MLFAIKKKTRTLSTAVFDDIFNSLIFKYVTGFKLLSRRFYLNHTMLKVNFYLKQAPGMENLPGRTDGRTRDFFERYSEVALLVRQFFLAQPAKAWIFMNVYEN